MSPLGAETAATLAASGADAPGLPGPDECRAAAARLRGAVVETPVRPLPWLARRLGRPVWAKLEQVQHTGSFKARGALNALAQIPRGRTVIAASAGNHSLAVAEMARRTGHRVVLCLPTTASALKRERLSAYDVAVVSHGSTLDEATAHARGLADREGWVFLSPYNDRRVIAGQASLGYELHAQLPELDAVVLPVGGGGLAAGVGLAGRDLGRAARVIGVQPQRFPAMTQSLAAGEAVRAVFRPSLADGLLVNPDREAATLTWAQGGLDALHLLDEEALAAGALALFARESLLCEPSGAAPVAAALDGALDALPGSGPIALLLTGGNLALGVAAQLLAYPFRRPELVAALELHHRSADSEPVFRGPAKQSGWTPSSVPAWSQNPLAREMRARLQAAEARLDDYVTYCRAEGLALAPAEIAAADGLRAAARTLAGSVDDTPGRPPAQRERCLRLGLRAAAFLSEAVAWQAPSYEQTGLAPFNAVGQQRSAQVNYTRYASPLVTELEAAVADTLGLRPERASVLLTSSGMAAVTLVESWLLRRRLKAGDRIVCQPGLYFETLEQFAELPQFTLHQAEDDGLEAIVAATAAHQPRVVVVEPLVNTPELRLLDLRTLFVRIQTVARGPVTVVVDGTMLSGALDPFAAARGLDGVEVIYLESGAKYLQAGLDMAPLGLVAVAPEQRAAFDRLRRNTGTILYESAAALVPRLERGEHLARMQRMTDNCRLLCEALSAYFAGTGPVGVRAVFPGLPAHPDHAAAQSPVHLGGVMTLRFRPAGLNNRWLLDSCIDHVMAQARSDGTPLTKGVSFGFSAPRISAAWALAETSAPFLRLSAGDQDAPATARLADTLCAGLASFFAAYGSVAGGAGPLGGR